MDYIWIAIIAVIALIFISMAIKIVTEYERGVIFRLGRLVGAKGPGIFVIIPFIDRMVRVDLRVVICKGWNLLQDDGLGFITEHVKRPIINGSQHAARRTVMARSATAAGRRRAGSAGRGRRSRSSPAGGLRARRRCSAGGQ